MSEKFVRQLQRELDSCLNEARNTATRFGLSVPKVLMVLRDPDAPKKIICIGNDDPEECLAAVREFAVVETPPLTPRQTLALLLGLDPPEEG